MFAIQILSTQSLVKVTYLAKNSNSSSHLTITISETVAIRHSSSYKPTINMVLHEILQNRDWRSHIYLRSRTSNSTPSIKQFSSYLNIHISKRHYADTHYHRSPSVNSILTICGHIEVSGANTLCTVASESCHIRRKILMFPPIWSSITLKSSFCGHTVYTVGYDIRENQYPSSYVLCTATSRISHLQSYQSYIRIYVRYDHPYVRTGIP